MTKEELEQLASLLYKYEKMQSQINAPYVGRIAVSVRAWVLLDIEAAEDRAARRGQAKVRGMQVGF